MNLAPADVPKAGSGFDLPIILGILAAAGDVPPNRLEGTMAIGELGLDGSLRPIRGALPIALHAAETDGISRVLLPAGNAREAAVAK